MIGGTDQSLTIVNQIVALRGRHHQRRGRLSINLLCGVYSVEKIFRRRSWHRSIQKVF
jgi:hypothetical protein